MKHSKLPLAVLVFAVLAALTAAPAVFAATCDGRSQASPLRVEKEMPPQIVIGKPYAYKIHVTNQSECPTDDVSVVETLPKAYELGSTSPEPSKMTGQVAQWDLGSLKPRETRVIAINGSAKSAGSFQTCTKVFHSQTICFAPELGMPAILLEVIDTEDPVQIGGMEKFYVIVTNQGNAPDENIAVKVGFEENFDYMSSAGPTQARVAEAKNVEFAPLASLAPGEKATWEISAKALKEGDHRTSVKITSDAIQRSVDETEATRVY